MGLFSRVKNYTAKRQAKSFWDTSIRAIRKVEGHIKHGKRNEYDMLVFKQYKNIFDEMINNPPVDEKTLANKDKMGEILSNYKRVRDSIDSLERYYNEMNYEKAKPICDYLCKEFKESGEY